MECVWIFAIDFLYLGLNREKNETAGGADGKVFSDMGRCVKMNVDEHKITGVSWRCTREIRYLFAPSCYSIVEMGWILRSSQVILKRRNHILLHLVHALSHFPWLQLRWKVFVKKSYLGTFIAQKKEHSSSLMLSMACKRGSCDRRRHA